MNEKLKQILKELDALEDYAYNVRLDWSSFDGRDALRVILEHTTKIRELLEETREP